MNERRVVWKASAYAGMEHLSLREDDTGVQVESVVIAVENQATFRLDYTLNCNFAYAVLSLTLSLAQDGQLHLTSDGGGKWFDDAQQPLPDLDGCFDVDISATPFTNTLPIRRLQWQPGQSETLKMAYILVPDLSVRVDQQRYTCLEKSAEGAIFRYEGLGSDFMALLTVDRDGLVLDYPRLFERVWAG